MYKSVSESAISIGLQLKVSVALKKGNPTVSRPTVGIMKALFMLKLNQVAFSFHYRYYIGLFKLLPC